MSRPMPVKVLPAYASCAQLQRAHEQRRQESELYLVTEAMCLSAAGSACMFGLPNARWW